MTFINPRKIFIGLLFCVCSSPALAQFTGGDGSGAIVAAQIQAACPLVSYPAIFAGGQDDGYSLSGITQSSCTPIVLPSIFVGGQDGGYSLSGVTQSSCTPVVLPSIFVGGQDDGYSLVGITQSLCSSPVLPNIYAGGVGSIDAVNQLNAGCAPLADFSATPLTVCVGDTVHFTDLSAGSPISWSWSFAGGTPAIASTQNPWVVYNTPGTYDVSLSITSLTGTHSIIKTNYITVGALPIVMIGPISPVCENTPAFALTQGSPAGGIYSGTGVSAGVFNAAVAGLGNHPISYVYTNGSGCSNSAAAGITVNPIYSF
jgi:hypothetical protein